MSTTVRSGATSDERTQAKYALVMNLERESDRYLFEELDVEQRKLPLNNDPEERKQIWREIFALRAELERRYPPAFDPLE